MHPWAKAAIAVVLIGFVITAVSIVVAARWFAKQTDGLRSKGETIAREAEAVGRGKTEEACIAESFVRLDKCSGVMCQAEAYAFLSKCLSAANVSPQLCARIPPRSEFVARAKWPMEECTRRGRVNDMRCAQVLGAIPTYCDKVGGQQ